MNIFVFKLRCNHNQCASISLLDSSSSSSPCSGVWSFGLSWSPAAAGSRCELCNSRRLDSTAFSFSIWTHILCRSSHKVCNLSVLNACLFYDRCLIKGSFTVQFLVYFGHKNYKHDKLHSAATWTLLLEWTYQELLFEWSHLHFSFDSLGDFVLGLGHSLAQIFFNQLVQSLFLTRQSCTFIAQMVETYCSIISFFTDAVCWLRALKTLSMRGNVIFKLNLEHKFADSQSRYISLQGMQLN